MVDDIGQKWRVESVLGIFWILAFTLSEMEAMGGF